MGRRPGLDAVREHIQEGEKHDVPDGDLRYRATLATLLRIKRKERVPPLHNDKVFNHDTLVEGRFSEPRGNILDPRKPPAFPYHCEADCETCFTQYFPGRISVTDQEAQSAITALAGSIHTNLAYLRQALGLHADFIVTRWKKKSKAKRAEFLSSRFSASETAPRSSTHGEEDVRLFDQKWAAIHFIHAQDNDDFRDFDMTKLYEHNPEMANRALVDQILLHALDRVALDDLATRYRTTWLLPYLDIESLAEDPLIFLSLLNHRTAANPEDWMMFDNLQLKLAEHWQVIIPEFNPHCVVMQGSEYGKKLVPWDKHRCHRWEIVGYQKAHLLLTAQKDMMSFLRSTVQGLLEETQRPCEQLSIGEVGRSAFDPPNLSQHPKFQQLRRNDFFSFGHATMLSVRASANQPFSAPPRFEPFKALEIVESMYRQSVDELELAQTDPAYLQLLIRELGATAYFERIDKKSKWDWYMDEIPCNLFRRFIWWRQLLRECKVMVECYVRYRETKSPGNSTAFDQAVHILYDISTEHLTTQLLLLDYSLPFQPGFERNFKWGNAHHADGATRPTIEEKDEFQRDKMFWSLRGMGFDEHRRFTMDPSFHLRVLDDHLSHADGKERKRISEVFLHRLSEVAVVEELRTAIVCDRNWDRHPDFTRFEMAPFRREFVKQYQEKLSLPMIIQKSQVSSRLRTFCQEHTWPRGNMNNDWLTRAEASRNHLTKFWDCFRDAISSHQQRNGLSKCFIDEDREALSMAHRPQYAEIIEEDRRLVDEQNSLRSSNPMKQYENTLPTHSPLPMDKEPCSFTPSSFREKKKTRPTKSDLRPSRPQTTPLDSDETASDSSPASDTAPCRVFVKPENLSILMAMFAPSKAQSRSFAWRHFVQAMADAGFSVLQGSGSAVSFKNSKGLIVFHQPHPESVIDPIMLRSMGKRMKKWFGWNDDTFAVKIDNSTTGSKQ